MNHLLDLASRTLWRLTGRVVDRGGMERRVTLIRDHDDRQVAAAWVRNSPAVRLHHQQGRAA